MKTIPLTRGKVALVDDQDYERIAAFKWCAVRPNGASWYAMRRVRGDWSRVTYMHRDLMTEASEVVDHINGDGLDNRRSNLRGCRGGSNQANRVKRKKTSSRFKGVHFFKRDGTWQAYVRRTHLGYFASEVDAAKAYDAAARKEFGSFARLNFPRRGERSALEESK